LILGALADVEEPELVECAKREAAAFAELYRRHHGPVYRFIYSRLRNRTDSEDVTSDVFLRALKSIAGFRDRGFPFRNWLLKIAANALKDHWRRSRLVEDLDEHQDDLIGDEVVEDVVIVIDLVRQIGHAAHRLPARQRAAFVLRLAHDLDAEEVARRMGTTQGAVKLLLHRAVRGVRTGLPDDIRVMELAS
jgi:RNA polymerase sigma-70 factor (ECF subfamily)